MRNMLLAALTTILVAGFGTAASASGCSQNNLNSEGIVQGNEFSTTQMSGPRIPCASLGTPQNQNLTGQQSTLQDTAPNPMGNEFSWDIDKPTSLTPNANGDDLTGNRDSAE